MTVRLSLTGLLLVVLLVPRPMHARWESPQDSKSASQLEGMSTDALFNEAFDVCVARALGEGPANDAGEPANPSPPGAGDYLGAIGQVAAEKNGGTNPPWMSELAAAHTVQRCQQAFRTFLAVKVTPAASAATARAQKKPTPKPAKRPRPSSQLPPWLR